MATRQRIRVTRALREAEGYLELNLPRQALLAIDRVGELGTFRALALYLRGEAWRAMECHAEAIAPLVEAAELSPGNAHIWLALGWCYKRVGQLPQAIAALEQVANHPEHGALVAYNLACYHSLASHKSTALDYLAQAIQMSAQYRDLVADESDFDTLRHDPEFQALLSVVV